MNKKIRLKALFQIDPISTLNLKTDSSIFLIKEGLELGIDVFISNPLDLTFFNNNALTFCKKVSLKNSNFFLGNFMNKSIDKFDFFFIRQDPPFDLNYLTNCYLLELHQKFNNKPKFINDPKGIKNFTEKIFPLYFNKLMPKTLVTSNENIFQKMLSKNKDIILKTLYNKGGEGVVKVSKSDKNALKIFRELKKTYKSPVVVQKFINKVSSGDKRVILIDGNPVGAINRVPKEGQYKANLHLGGKAEATILTKKEVMICETIKSSLVKNNLTFVGIDLIQEKLTEINVTSPTGIVQIMDITGINIAKKLWKKLIRNSNSINNEKEK